MSKLTLKEAFEYSIKKFEAIIENDGFYISFEKKKKLGIDGFINRCGLCEYYEPHHEPGFDPNCHGCPLVSEKINCFHENHIYQKWENHHTKKNAQSVLDLIIFEYNKYLYTIDYKIK